MFFGNGGHKMADNQKSEIKLNDTILFLDPENMVFHVKSHVMVIFHAFLARKRNFSNGGNKMAARGATRRIQGGSTSEIDCRVLTYTYASNGTYMPICLIHMIPCTSFFCY